MSQFHTGIASLKSTINRLVYGSVGWLAGWVIDWWVGWSWVAGGLVGGLIDRWVGWLVDCGWVDC